MPEDKRAISKEEFCRLTHTSPDCWIFGEAGGKAEFYEAFNENEKKPYWYYYNGIDAIRRFKDMPEYKEVWISVLYTGIETVRTYNLWTTWTQYE